MNVATVILGAALLLLVVLIVYAVAADPAWAQRSYLMAHLVESPWGVYRRSDGTFDDAAALALQRATGRANPTPAEHALAALVITRNVLAQEHRPARDGAGAPTRLALERAQLRRGMYDAARAHHMAAVAGLGPAQRWDRATHDTATFVVETAMGFAFGGLTELLANDPVIAAGDWDFDNVTILQGRAVDQPLATAATRLRDDLVRERRAVAQAAAESQGGALGAGVAAYVELATQNTDDPQNTHDTGVLACLKAIVERLREDQGEAAVPTPDEVAAEIRDRGEELSEGRAHRLADVGAVIARTKAGDRVVALGATDAECLGRVWLRAADPRNAAVRGQLRQAVFDALYDCWEDGLVGRKIVCVNGRSSRILSALILLDWDRRNWEVKRLEQFKNDIFARAAEVIEAEATRALDSDDPDMRRAGRLHLARTPADLADVGEVPDAVAERLAEQMRAAIAAMVGDYVRGLEADLGVRGAVPDYMVAAVTAEAQAAVVA